MTLTVDPADLCLREFLRPGDHIVWSQACGEPTTLIDALLAQADDIGPLSAFAATSFSGHLDVAAAEKIAISSMGGIGDLRTLTAAHRLGVIPCHVGQERRAAAGRFLVSMRSGRQPFEPNLPLIANMCGQPIGPDQWMGPPPDPALDLPERLGQPTRQRQIVKIAKDGAIFFPQAVERRFGHRSHALSKSLGWLP